jgi:amino acid transporter
VNPSNWFVSHWENVNWLKFFNIMFWNLNYWDTVSTVAGEVESPESTYPKALGIAVVLVVISYLAPLLVGVGVAASATDWGLGYFADIGILVGGRWLGWWIVVAAAVSQVGQFQAEMVTDSFQLLGMAERGFLPSLFKRRSVHGTPTAAIVCSSIGIIGMLSLNFMQIVELLNAVYCLAEILEFSAFLWLRYR